VDLQQFSRLFKAAMASISAFEGVSLTVVEDSFRSGLCLKEKEFADLKAGRSAPDRSALEYIADQCLHRAPLNENWLFQLLVAAGHADPQSFASKHVKRKLYPVKRPLHNLPAPTYAKYVPRQRVYEQLRTSLTQSWPAVAVVSLGGMGKTCFVIEAADALMHSVARHNSVRL
jgi:hypothetical protein